MSSVEVPGQFLDDLNDQLKTNKRDYSFGCKAVCLGKH